MMNREREGVTNAQPQPRPRRSAAAARPGAGCVRASIDVQEFELAVADGLRPDEASDNALPPGIEFEVTLKTQAEAHAIRWTELRHGSTTLVSVVAVDCGSLHDPSGELLGLRHGDFVVSINSEWVLGKPQSEIAATLRVLPSTLRLRRFIRRPSVLGEGVLLRHDSNITTLTGSDSLVAENRLFDDVLLDASDTNHSFESNLVPLLTADSLSSGLGLTPPGSPAGAYEAQLLQRACSTDTMASTRSLLQPYLLETDGDASEAHSRDRAGGEFHVTRALTHPSSHSTLLLGPTSPALPERSLWAATEQDAHLTDDGIQALAPRTFAAAHASAAASCHAELPSAEFEQHGARAAAAFPTRRTQPRQGGIAQVLFDDRPPSPPAPHLEPRAGTESWAAASASRREVEQAPRRNRKRGAATAAVAFDATEARVAIAGVASAMGPPAIMYRGVYRRFEKWSAQIQHEGKKVYLGSYPTLEDAARAYDKAARRMHGAAARLNFPGERPGEEDDSLVPTEEAAEALDRSHSAPPGLTEPCPIEAEKEDLLNDSELVITSHKMNAYVCTTAGAGQGATAAALGQLQVVFAVHPPQHSRVVFEIADRVLITFSPDPLQLAAQLRTHAESEVLALAHSRVAELQHTSPPLVPKLQVPPGLSRQSADHAVRNLRLTRAEGQRVDAIVNAFTRTGILVSYEALASVFVHYVNPRRDLWSYRRIIVRRKLLSAHRASVESIVADQQHSTEPFKAEK